MSKKSKVKTGTLPMALADLTLALFLTAGETFGENLLSNASFENADDGMPAAWRTHVWNGAGDFRYGEVGHSGRRCVVISSEAGGDLSWFIKVRVKPYSRYRLSGWIRTDSVASKGGSGVLFNEGPLANQLVHAAGLLKMESHLIWR